MQVTYTPSLVKFSLCFRIQVFALGTKLSQVKFLPRHVSQCGCSSVYLVL
jgi:hypothetical protein